jgi:hypothetical protein
MDFQTLHLENLLAILLMGKNAIGFRNASCNHHYHQQQQLRDVISHH